MYAIRVGLGLPAEPPKGKDLADVPADLDQTFSTRSPGAGDLLQSAAQFGYFPTTWDATRGGHRNFINRTQVDSPSSLGVGQAGGLPNPAVDWTAKTASRPAIYRPPLIPEAPAIKQAEAKLLQAQRDLDQAKLNLRYCDVVGEIDGVVTRRNVNPGNNVAGRAKA